MGPRSGRVAIIFVLAIVVSIAARGISSTTEKAQLFFGSKPAKVVYNFEGAVYYIDFSENPLREHTIFTGLIADQSLQISPDGTRICYAISGKTYVRSVRESSPTTDLKSIGTGLFPHWWTHPTTGDEYLILQRTDGIYCQKLDASSNPSGTATKLIGNKLANAGRSRDGKYLVSDEDDMMWQISPSTAVSGAAIDATVKFGGVGNDSAYCNASCSPAFSTSSKYYACLMHLGRHHTQVYVRKFTTSGQAISGAIFVLGSRIEELPVSIIGEGEWVHPEWSTHENYFTSGGIPYDSDLKGFASGFVVDIAQRKSLKFMDAGLRFTHLWVQTSQAATPVARISATPTQGAVPLAVQFDGSTSSGTGLSYTWNFGDGTTGSGAKVSHSYTKAGTFTATLTVAAGGKSSTATIEIKVGTTAATLTSITLLPEGPLSVSKGSSTTFQAMAKDQFGQVMANPGTVTWSVVGSAGGKVTASGAYTAGTTVGAVETVVAAIGTVKGTCRVTILDLPIILSSDPAGKSFTTGDTLRIQWTADALRAPALVIYFSNDGGKSWFQISQGNSVLKTDSYWQNYPWVIPLQVTGSSGNQVTTASDQCKIKVEAYDNPGDVAPAISGLFRIIERPMAAGHSVARSRTEPCILQHGGRALDIWAGNGAAGTSLRIFDLGGREVLNVQLRGNGAISVDHLSPGLYRAALYAGSVHLTSTLLRTR